MYKFIKVSTIESIKKENEDLRDELQSAAQLVSKMASGNLEDQTEEVNKKKNSPLLKSLLDLQLHLKKVADEEKQRSWSSQGLAKFVEILRNNSEDNKELYDTIISNLVKYLNANQGGLFVINDADDKNVHLELKACYAYDKKKFVDKTIVPGQGLIGQCYLEKETIIMTEIPDDYITITSGLGTANPNCLIIVPLKTNDKIVGIVEIASFDKFEDYQVEFIEKLSESIAITIANMLTNVRTKNLLVMSQESTEELRAQEEELRQNMEEMSALQEDLERQLAHMKVLKEELEIRERVFGTTTIISEADKFGTITYANDKLCEIAKYSREEMIGKGHNLFRHPDMPSELFKLMWETIKNGEVFRGIVKNRAKDGSHYWVDATIVPIKNGEGEIVKYVGARYHITNDSLAEDLFKNQPAMAIIKKMKDNK